jgi:hypothetical protein
MKKRHAETKGRPCEGPPPRPCPAAQPSRAAPGRALPNPTQPYPGPPCHDKPPKRARSELIAIPAAGFHERPHTDGMHAPMIKAEASFVDLVGGDR